MFGFFKELVNLVRFFSEKNKAKRRLVFYAESSFYYKFLEGFIDYVLDNSDIHVCYITSDPSDPVLKFDRSGFWPFYFDKLLAQVMLNLDAVAIVFTMPDLDNFHLKRSLRGAEHVYVFHGIGSIHLGYSEGAFDGYDTIFCVGPYDIKEFQRHEEICGHKTWNLVKCGYYRLEQIFLEHTKYELAGGQNRNEKVNVLIAPSWHKQNILERCIGDLVCGLSPDRFNLIIRPHPEFLKRNPRQIAQLRNQFGGLHHITFDLNAISERNIHEADILITDWSGIAFEFALGTVRPVLFINTPRRINNLNYQSLGIEPIDSSARNRIGLTVYPTDLQNVAQTVERLMQERSHYAEEIIRFRKELVYNWLQSAAVGGQYLVDLCKIREDR